MIVECLNCGSTQNLNHADGFQVCEHCGEIFPVPDEVLRREAGEPDTPRTVIRGVVTPAPTVNIPRSIEKRSEQKVFCDFLSFTLPANLVYGYGDEKLKNIAKLLQNAFPEFGFNISDSGIFGYTHSASIFISGQQVGLVATGGNSGTTYIQLTGHATAWLDLKAWASWLDQSKARLTRVDLAHDDFDGIHTVDEVREQYLLGGFRNRGQNPTSSAVGPWDDPAQYHKGRTYYVGKRENGKMLRTYEKGKQLGSEASPWVRHEVEFRKQKDKPLTTDMLRNPTSYFAGAYEYLQWIETVEVKKLDRIQQEVKISFDALVAYAKTAYGKLVNVMLTVHESAERVVDELIAEGVPRRLQPGTLPAH